MPRLFAGKPPADLGVTAGRLKPCPTTPNCVHSQSAGRAHIDPLVFRGNADAALRGVRSILAAMPRVRVVEHTDDYLRAEASSRWLGFIDDVEFLLDPDASVIHVRSAARMGYSDFGVNRARVERIRAAFAAAEHAGLLPSAHDDRQA
ncbi:MAG: DUF1499 domain-containing protein [Burkholderiales bacterium]|nr:DUF1499 domain-containing protein [Burkholderiales bacterium]